MSYTPTEICVFEKVLSEMKQKIEEYYESAHKAIAIDHWNEQYKNDVRESIVKLMEFEKYTN